MLYGVGNIVALLSTTNGLTYQCRIKKSFESWAGTGMRIVETVYILLLQLHSKMQHPPDVDFAVV